MSTSVFYCLVSLERQAKYKEAITDIWDLDDVPRRFPITTLGRLPSLLTNPLSESVQACWQPITAGWVERFLSLLLQVKCKESVQNREDISAEFGAEQYRNVERRICWSAAGLEGYVAFHAGTRASSM